MTDLGFKQLWAGRRRDGHARNHGDGVGRRWHQRALSAVCQGHGATNYGESVDTYCVLRRLEAPLQVIMVLRVEVAAAVYAAPTIPRDGGGIGVGSTKRSTVGVT
jgi:hypothetical protein